MNTGMLSAGEESGDPPGRAATRAVTSAGDVLEPAEAADSVPAAMEDERFLILPHRAVLEMHRQQGSDHDWWLRGMRRLRSSLLPRA
ncbi:hypothetical protein [Streptomyces sp. NRRL S-1022]|uniref:hypothetical protein n=1 Tax=Streptomyces sp. NRRL S-1022 TaxID=1463880 RepID=UPI00068D581A|nr:hypothetical protein [Streptomyces sp. NRRL S-1022]